jgi:Protein  of unknown function (DUF3018)
MGVHETLTGAQRTARYRAAKRAKGLRLKQIWVPDLSNPEVREKIRQSVAEINRRDRESGIMEEIDALADEMLASLPPYDWGDNPTE